MKITAITLVLVLVLSATVPAQNITTNLGGTASTRFGVDLNTGAAGFHNTLLGNLGVSLLDPSSSTKEGESPVRGRIQLSGFGWTYYQDGTKNAGLNSNLNTKEFPGLSGEDMGGGNIFHVPSINARLMWELGDIPCWVELIGAVRKDSNAEAGNESGSPWLVNSVKQREFSDLYTSGTVNDAGFASDTRNFVINEYYENQDVLLNLGNGGPAYSNTSRSTQWGWSTAGLSMGFQLPDENGQVLSEHAVHVFSRGNWQESRKTEESIVLIPANIESNYAVGWDSVFRPLEGFSLKLGSGIAFALAAGRTLDQDTHKELTPGAFAFRQWGGTVETLFSVPSISNGLDIALALDIATPRLPARWDALNLDASGGLSLNVGDPVPVGMDAIYSTIAVKAYSRIDLNPNADQEQNASTLNGRIILNKLSGDTSFLPGFGMKATFTAYDMLQTNEKSVNEVYQWAASLRADWLLAEAFNPYLGAQWGTARKNYDELNKMVAGLYSDADIAAGIDDLANKIVLDIGVKVLNVIDKVVLDLVWHNPISLSPVQTGSKGTVSFLAQVTF